MSHDFDNKNLSFISDTCMYKLLESGDFEGLKEMQASNEIKAQQKYFNNKIGELLKKKAEYGQRDEASEELLKKCNENLKDLIIGINDFTLGSDIAFGASSIVYRGSFRYLDVAIKKVALNTMYAKQLVH